MGGSREDTLRLIGDVCSTLSVDARLQHRPSGFIPQGASFGLANITLVYEYGLQTELLSFDVSMKEKDRARQSSPFNEICTILSYPINEIARSVLSKVDCHGHGAMQRGGSKT